MGNGTGWKGAATSVWEEPPPNQREHLTQSPNGRREQACVSKELKKEKEKDNVTWVSKGERVTR